TGAVAGGIASAGWSMMDSSPAAWSIAGRPVADGPVDAGSGGAWLQPASRSDKDSRIEWRIGAVPGNWFPRLADEGEWPAKAAQAGAAKCFRKPAQQAW